MEILPNFIVFEGGDGTGTSTQLNLLREKIPAPGRRVFLTCEPTGGPLGRIIRSVLGRELELTRETLAFLFAADRQEHLYGQGGVAALCREGAIVVSDRYVPSSLVYQGIDCGDELPRRLNEGFPAPQILFYFELDPLAAMERIGKREKKELFEYREFQEKVRQRYLDILPLYRDAGVEVISVNAARPVEKVAGDIWKVIGPLL
ncbi:MAG: dTMP kinase [Spirochaetaceae bacterium]|jgi:dTMP kinase|nr:dTMP kinase [Spirochaetaceae bacterium]